MSKFDQIYTLKSPSEINDFCDSFFSLGYQDVESKLTSDNELDSTYSGENLQEEALNTSWADYFLMITYLKDKNLKMLDLGSAYSKGTLLCEVMGIDTITSVEIVSERVQESKRVLERLNLSSDRVLNMDALSIDLDSFDVYFLYQPVSFFLTKLLHKISLQKTKKLWAIESHGDLINRISLDSRFNQRKKLLDFSSARHNQGLYEFVIDNSDLNELSILEDKLYKAKCALIRTEVKNIGPIEWLLPTSSVEIDYLNNEQAIYLNGRKFLSSCCNDVILEIDPVLNSSWQKYIEKSYITYNGREQKVLKHIVKPENTIELSKDGIVTMPLSSFCNS
jgi:hypothetical protein